jgi:hypothetical protein
MAILLSGLSSAQSYSGGWSMTPTVQYSCMQGILQFSINRFAISGVYPSVAVTLQPTFSAGVLTGTFGTPSSFTATRVVPGSCTETYQITLAFQNSNQFTGTFSATFTGQGCTTPFGYCATQTWQIAGVRQLAAAYATFGAGCAGNLGVPHLLPVALPRLGTTCQVQLDNLPLGVAFLVTGFSNTASSLGPLPASLTAFGMPGCLGRTSLDVTEFVSGAGSAATWSLAIPNAPVLIGVLFYQQALVPAPGWNALGAVVSDAAAVTVGV